MTNHNPTSDSTRAKSLLVIVLIGALCLNTGCQAALATFLLLTGGHDAKAKYKFFNGKKVAVVCLAESMTDSRYDDVPRELAKAVGLHLSQNVKKIDIVSPTMVNKWLDRHESKIEDFQKFGKDMQADMVLVIYLDSFETSSPSSPGSYQGRATVSFSVYEMKTGNSIASESLSEYVYPPNFRQTGGTELRESDFKKRYLIQLSREIAYFFYAHDPHETMAMDAHSELMR